MPKTTKTITVPTMGFITGIDNHVSDVDKRLSEEIESFKKSARKELDEVRAETKENFLRMNKMFKDMFRENATDTTKGFKALEKSLKDIKSMAESADSLAGDVELDLEALTVRVDALEAKK